MSKTVRAGKSDQSISYFKRTVMFAVLRFALVLKFPPHVNSSVVYSPEI